MNIGNELANKINYSGTKDFTLTDRIISAMDNNDVPIGIFLDLSKAFDTIDHAILLSKL